MSAVHVLVPDWIDDVRLPSGGNVYDRRVCDGLAGLGWSVHEHAVAGTWPEPSVADLASLAAELTGIADGAIVLVDGLIGSAAAPVLVPEAERLSIVVLVHLPFGLDRFRISADLTGVDLTGVDVIGDDVIGAERAVLAAASAVVTTSHWTREWLLQTYRLDGTRLHVAEPGVDPAEPAPGTGAGGELLCVAALTPAKGHDIVLSALEFISGLPWRCTFVGSRELDPEFAAGLAARADRAELTGRGLNDRIRFTGPLTGAALAEQYRRADVAVLASRLETYGMVVTEALAHGLPVIATEVGGVPEALGRVGEVPPPGSADVPGPLVQGPLVPGVLVPPDDAEALAAALQAWLTDAGRRERLRAAARLRRPQLPGWDHTARRISDALNQAAVPPVSSVGTGPLSAERGR